MSPGRVLEQLYARRRFGIRPGVDRVGMLLDALGRPDRAFPSLHVVGTNGKGSTAAFLAAILTAAGCCTGLFTSPHLTSFTERFRVDGTSPGELEIGPHLASVLEKAPDEATFFEIVTSLAALFFSDRKVDIAVMEAGMGGRSDATAALSGIMTLITPIALDHCDYLGETLEQIAAEKCGIAGTGTPVVIGRQSPAAARAVRNALRAVPAGSCIWIDQDVSAAWNRDGTLDYRGITTSLAGLTVGIPGRYQLHNASLALTAAEALRSMGYDIPDSALRTGIATAHWPGRMELIPGVPPLLLDGAHNPAGAEALADALQDYRYDRLLTVLGIMADKDAAALCSSLIPVTSACYCVTPAVDRAMPDTALAALLQRAGMESRPCGSVAAGIAAARRDAGSNDLILVCGSLFTVGEAKAVLAGAPFEGIRG